MKPFTATLGALRHGKTLEELTQALADLVHACTETGKPGTLTLTVKVAPGKSGQLEIADAIASKLPAFERGSSLFFVTPDGDLSRTDPRQVELPGLRGVPESETKAA